MIHPLKLIFLLFIGSFPLLGQEPLPTGYYSFGTEYHDGEQFYFTDEGYFSYLDNCSDCGSREGYGDYTIAHDTLILLFHSAARVSADQLTYDRNFLSDTVASDSTSFFLTIEADSDFLYCLAQIVSDSGRSVRQCGGGKDVSFEIRIENSEKHSYLHLVSPGYNEEWIRISDLYQHSSIELVRGNKRIPPWVIYKYKLIAVNRNKIEMSCISRNDHSYYVTAKTVFRRGTL